MPVHWIERGAPKGLTGLRLGISSRFFALESRIQTHAALMDFDIDTAARVEYCTAYVRMASIGRWFASIANGV